MYVEIGNADAIEGYRDPTSDDPDLVRYKEAPGERVTRIAFPEGYTLKQAFDETVVALQYHMKEGSKPAWIESDSEGLRAQLLEQFGLTASEAKRPKSWGKEDGGGA